MNWWDIALIAIDAVGIISDFTGSQKAARDARRQGQIEKQQEEALTTEKLRQLGREEAFALGDVRKAAAGAGVVATKGSPQTIYEDTQAEYVKQKGIVRNVGATKVAAALGNANIVANQYRYSGYADIARGLTNIFEVFARRG